MILKDTPLHQYRFGGKLRVLPELPDKPANLFAKIKLDPDRSFQLCRR